MKVVGTRLGKATDRYGMYTTGFKSKSKKRSSKRPKGLLPRPKYATLYQPYAWGSGRRRKKSSRKSKRRRRQNSENIKTVRPSTALHRNHKKQRKPSLQIRPLQPKNRVPKDFGRFQPESVVKKEKLDKTEKEKKKVMAYKAIKKDVTHEFAKRFNSDQTYFKDVFGKTLGIDDKTNTCKTRDPNWNHLQLTFTKGETEYQSQHQGKQLEIKTESFGKWYENLPIRTKSKIPELKSQYIHNFRPFLVKDKKTKPKEKLTVANFSFLGNSHYRTHFYGITSKQPLSMKLGYQYHTVPMGMVKSKTSYFNDYMKNQKLRGDVLKINKITGTLKNINHVGKE